MTEPTNLPLGYSFTIPVPEPVIWFAFNHHFFSLGRIRLQYHTHLYGLPFLSYGGIISHRL